MEHLFFCGSANLRRQTRYASEADGFSSAPAGRFTARPEDGLRGQSGKSGGLRRSAAGIAAIIAVSLILGGCSGSYNAGDVGALQGAALGGAAGAVGGQVIGRNTTATISSAAGGALIGGVLGYFISRNNTRYCHYYDNDGLPYDAPCGKP